MRRHGGTPSRRDKHVTLAVISPLGVARGCFVWGQQSGLAGCKPPPLFTHGASSCLSQGRCQGEPWGASPRPSAPTYLPTSRMSLSRVASLTNSNILQALLLKATHLTSLLLHEAQQMKLHYLHANSHLFPHIFLSGLSALC